MTHEQAMQAASAPVYPQIPREILSLIPEFNGDTKLLNFFLRKCEYVIEQYQGTVRRNQFLMQYVTSRLTGRAAVLFSERNDCETYDQLKIVLIQHFGDPRSEECVAIELETLKIKQNESYLDFCGRIQDVRAILLSKVNQSNTSEMKKAKKIIYDNTSLNVFLYNLPEHMVRLVRLKNPESLEDSLKYVLEEVNFQEQYNMRSKMLRNQPQPQIAPLINNYKPIIPQTNFKFGIPGNQHLARPPFINQPFMRPQANFGYRPPMQFGYKPNFNSGPPHIPQFAPRPQAAQFGFRPQLQLHQNNFRPQVGQMGYNSSQFGFRPQPGQFGYRAPQTQTYHPQPFSNDVSMRTAPALPQKAHVNEMYNMTNDSECNVEQGYNYDGMDNYYDNEGIQPYEVTENREAQENQVICTDVYEVNEETNDVENFCLMVPQKRPK